MAMKIPNEVWLKGNPCAYIHKSPDYFLTKDPDGKGISISCRTSPMHVKRVEYEDLSKESIIGLLNALRGGNFLLFSLDEVAPFEMKP